MHIIVCPLSRAAEIARARRPARAISLLDPGTDFPHFEHLHDDHRLKLPVHDVEHDHEDFDAPRSEHLETIITFVRGWDRSAPLLVHCYAGISRSTATAFIAACAHNPSTPETKIAEALRAASPTASPNRRFIALADAALGRDGRMVRAIERIGRGGDWFEIGEARPFSIAAHFTDEA